MSEVRKNTVANYAGQAWSAIMGIVFVPIYIRYIGIEAYWPEDGYLGVACVNLFARPLLPQLAGGSDLSRLLTAAGYAIGVVCAVPYLAWLNLRIARACRVPWKCVPALSQRWLAMNPEFRAGCLELCRYLDQA